MFTNEEGEGWQQLGEGLMPSSSRDAGVMLEGFQKMGEQTVHGLLSGTSLPELHDALGAMFGPKPLTVGGADFPHLELFDSGDTSSLLSGGESTSVNFESAGIQPSSPSGTIETLQAPSANGGTLDFQSSGLSGGTIETLQTPASSGLSAESLQAPGADASMATQAAPDGVGKLGDAGGLPGDIGKAVTDLVGKMTDFMGALAQGPMGLLGSLLNFLLTIFTEILTSIGTAIAETARAAASLAAESWKKHLEAAT